MITKLMSILSSFLSSSKLGIVMTIIFSKTSSAIIKEILDKDNQRVAYGFVKDLHDRKDIDNSEKARLFNQKMLEWSGMMGRKLQSSVVNCLRELAVNAFKAENETEEGR